MFPSAVSNVVNREENVGEDCIVTVFVTFNASLTDIIPIFKSIFESIHNANDLKIHYDYAFKIELSF